MKMHEQKTSIDVAFIKNNLFLKNWKKKYLSDVETMNTIPKYRFKENEHDTCMIITVEKLINVQISMLKLKVIIMSGSKNNWTERAKVHYNNLSCQIIAESTVLFIFGYHARKHQE